MRLQTTALLLAMHLPCSHPLRVVVIGGGAAGFFGATRAAQASRAAGGLEVVVLEAGTRLLTKVRSRLGRVSRLGRLEPSRCLRKRVATGRRPR